MDDLYILRNTTTTLDTQRDRIFRYMLDHNGEVELWRLIAPRPEGLGIAQYNARIKELREVLEVKGWEIKNEAGRRFFLKRKVTQETLF